jgi:hypothetical protein
MLPAVIDPPSGQIENLMKLKTVPRAIATAISARSFVSDRVSVPADLPFFDSTSNWLHLPKSEPSTQVR